MKQRLIYGTVVIVLALNLTLGARVYFSTAAAAEKDSPYPNLELFSFVMEKVRRDYVDGTNLTYQQLVHGALRGMVDTLDPHSEFLEPEKYKELQSDTQGQFGGLGIVIQMRDNFVTVVTPIEDTPGFRAGILAGDRLMKIDGKSAEKMSVEEAVKLLRGEPDTDVTLTMQRPTSGDTKDYTLTRAVIKVDMAKDINGKKEFPLLENKIGYVRLTQFGERTSAELDAALKKLKAQGMQALILDLRGNPGGLLDQAVEVCERFLPRAQLVVSTEGRNNKRDSKITNRNGEYRDLPLVVLVNYGSASASEIVSGALQDCAELGKCKAIVIGEKTFGKGSVQEIMPLEGGAALRLTTSKYYTPSHKVIHEHGITPDIIVPMSDEEERLARLKVTPGGVESVEESERDAVRNARDPQLERATDVLKGIMVFTERSPDPASKAKSGKIASRAERN
ncbi:MAG: S41 family peptidase [Verrucomicrobiota bacterium]